MKRLISITILCALFLGCTHCSKTVTMFKGKTTGINPYGSGNIRVDRESYWGSLECIVDMLSEYETEVSNDVQ